MNLCDWKPVFRLFPCLKRLAASWLLACSVTAAISETPFVSPSFAAEIAAGRILLLTALFFLFATLAARFLREIYTDDALLIVAPVLYAVVLTARYKSSHSRLFVIALLAGLALALFPLLRHGKFPRVRFPGKKTLLVLLFCLGTASAAVIGAVTCLRYKCYDAPNFDFGIFCNMFYRMKTTLLPLVTCERNTLLSHFAVHISPIFYLLLPVYALFPSPLTLQIGQAVIVASGLIPLYLLAVKYRLSRKTTLVIALLYALYTPLSTGCFYDIHENCFLTPLLLWLFSAYEYQRPRLTWVAAAAVLLVKEDAAFYLLVFAVYLFVSRKERRKGLLLGGAALAYFVLAVFLLMTVGDGAMFGRYNNLATSNGGLAAIAVNFLRNPGYFIEQLLSTSSGDREKLWYLFLLLAPLAFLPFLTRRYSRFLLLVPLLLNLLTRYKYQYNIGYQYSFGIAAFLFYLTVLNLSEWKGTSRRPLLLLAVCASCFLYTMNVIPRLESLIDHYHQNQTVYQQMDALLDTIPSDASVTASSMLVPHLAERDTIYEIAYHPEPDTQYLVLDMRPAYQKRSQEQSLSWLNAGYVVDREQKDLLLILKKDEA